jgi:hypothetical protein
MAVRGVRRIKRRNAEHRTSNIERRIKRTVREELFKAALWLCSKRKRPTPKAFASRRSTSNAERPIRLGEGGIRTLGALLRHGALAKRCFRPLSHLTKEIQVREYAGEFFFAKRDYKSPIANDEGMTHHESPNDYLSSSSSS